MASFSILDNTVLGFPALSLTPAARTISGAITTGGSGVSRTVLFFTSYGLFLGSTQSAESGTYSFSVGLDMPVLVVVLGLAGERPLAHMVTPG